MADPKRIRITRPTPSQAEPREAQARPSRPRILDKDLRAARSALIEEAERIMGVTPILGRTGPRPGY
ncbi:hypothetical protein [Paracoccus marinaquae]|uniref:Transposase n=1 Tax=Paracoccus marinaquae TaxID=2841926 RepID=A0ABS6AFJ0_9RHOB|nr:hypothetical protein [Paracoccus marinaquae]MBU3029269.1 hypothetical protein [Paracoccus marinaquae]